PAWRFGAAKGNLTSAKAMAWENPPDIPGKPLPLITRHQVGKGAVIVTLMPNLLGQDERAHPALAYLMNGLTAGLLPVEVRLANGARPRGEIMHQINKAKEGYLVTLVSCRGIDKTQTGLARVDRTAYVDVVLRTRAAVKSAREYTQPRDLPLTSDKDHKVVRLRIHPGDVQVVSLVTK